jgi:hypothetical protein
MQTALSYKITHENERHEMPSNQISHYDPSASQVTATRPEVKAGQFNACSA